MSNQTIKNSKTQVRRAPQRANYDRQAIYKLLDSSYLCHIAYVIKGIPYLTPTLFWRESDYVYWHGSSASRMLKAQSEGIDVCFNIAHLDGFVLARSAFHHSANYRSVTIYGKAEWIKDNNNKAQALNQMMEHFFPGRMTQLRNHHSQEIKATKILRLKIEEAVMKTRTGNPIDEEEDYEQVKCWAGVIPIKQVTESPYDDGKVKLGYQIPPDYKFF